MENKNKSSNNNQYENKKKTVQVTQYLHAPIYAKPKPMPDIKPAKADEK